MFYGGWSDPNGRWDVGYAESIDGINWNKHPSPVLMGTSRLGISNWSFISNKNR